MEEIYEAIEAKIKEAGYPGEVDGYEIYNDICNQIEEKEPGEYVLMSKPESLENDSIYYEYRLQIMEDDFNLSLMTIHTPKQDYVIDFDA